MIIPILSLIEKLAYYIISITVIRKFYHEYHC